MYIHILEMWLMLGQIKKKLSPTWRQQEKESNPARRQKDTGQNTGPRQGEKKRNVNVIHIHSTQIKYGTTQGQKYDIATNKKMAT